MIAQRKYLLWVLIMPTFTGPMAYIFLLVDSEANLWTESQPALHTTQRRAGDRGDEGRRGRHDTEAAGDDVAIREYPKHCCNTCSSMSIQIHIV